MIHTDRTILIIDDNESLYESLAQNFQQEGYGTSHARNRLQALDLFPSARPAVVLLDIRVGDENGIDILAELHGINKSIPIIMITGYASVDTAVQSLKIGAVDYIKKPLDFDLLLRIVQKAMELTALSQENKDLKDRLSVLSPRICARSAQLLELLATAKKLATTDLPILITGENGTGKELIADAIHSASSRALKPMLKINCAAFPESLLDNELFGHERGSYTGAESVFKGVFERANKSTLFLDEIGDMPLTLQVKILRTLQSNELRRIGGTETLKIDVRFIAATNHDLDSLIREGKFREDLYYRLNAAIIHIPSLRDRMEDVPELASFFCEEFAIQNSVPVKRISEPVMQFFTQYQWPGNVRELRNAVNYANALSSGNSITLSDLPPVLTREHTLGDKLNVREVAEKSLITRTLQDLDNNKKRAAEFLSMSRRTLYNKLAKYGISTSRD